MRCLGWAISHDHEWGTGLAQSYLASICQWPSWTAASQAVPSSVITWNLARLRAACGRHHRSATGQGPAQAVIASHGPPPADIRAGGAERWARPVTVTGAPAASVTLAGSGSWHTVAGTGTGIRPGQGRSV